MAPPSLPSPSDARRTKYARGHKTADSDNAPFQGDAVPPLPTSPRLAAHHTKYPKCTNSTGSPWLHSSVWATVYIVLPRSVNLGGTSTPDLRVDRIRQTPVHLSANKPYPNPFN